MKHPAAYKSTRVLAHINLRKARQFLALGLTRTAELYLREARSLRNDSNVFRSPKN